MSQFDNLSNSLLNSYLAVLSPLHRRSIASGLNLNEPLGKATSASLQGHLRATLEQLATETDKVTISCERGEHGTKELVALQQKGESHSPVKELHSLADWFNLPDLLRKMADHVETNVVGPLKETLVQLAQTTRDLDTDHKTFETGALAHQLLMKLAEMVVKEPVKAPAVA